MWAQPLLVLQCNKEDVGSVALFLLLGLMTVRQLHLLVTTKQYATPLSTVPFLIKKGKKFIQQVCGKFLFLGRVVDITLLWPISAIASHSSTPTEETMQQTQHLLYYIATQEEAVLTFNAIDMKLVAHSDASYLSKQKECSRAGGHLPLSSNSTIPQNNGAVLNIAHIIKHGMSSAT